MLFGYHFYERAFMMGMRGFCRWHEQQTSLYVRVGWFDYAIIDLFDFVQKIVEKMNFINIAVNRFTMKNYAVYNFLTSRLLLDVLMMLTALSTWFKDLKKLMPNFKRN